MILKHKLKKILIRWETEFVIVILVLLGVVAILATVS